MSIPLSGTLYRRSRGVISAIIKQLRTVNLKPVKRINVCFDPFHERVKDTRDFLYYISAPRIGKTNPYCSLKTEIVCDRSDPVVTFNLQSGEKVILKTAYLSCLNILELYNKHISSLIPPDPDEIEAKQLLLEKRRKQERQKLRLKRGSKRRGVIL